MTNEQLMTALDDLDALLTKHEIRLDIFICGAMALSE